VLLLILKDYALTNLFLFVYGYSTALLPDVKASPTFRNDIHSLKTQTKHIIIQFINKFLLDPNVYHTALLPMSSFSFSSGKNIAINEIPIHYNTAIYFCTPKFHSIA
jgi:hypothetical protein